MPESDAPESVEFLVPGDPQQNTGGYRYVRKLVEALCEDGCMARVSGLPGQFPRPDRVARNAMDERLASFPDGTCVVLDGLAMGGLPEILEKHSHRLNLLALVHHPLADETGISEADRQWFFESEKWALGFVKGVITTSQHTAFRLADYDVPTEAIRVAEPGVARANNPKARIESSEKDGPRILCVAHLSPRKAQHQLVEALEHMKALPWHCTLAGSDTRDPGYSHQVRRAIAEAGLENRIQLVGEVDETELADLYGQADFFVLPSLYEGYGMVIDEALAEGLPVISSDGGALANTSARPGVVQYCAGDVRALEARIRNWLEHPDQLDHSRKLAARESRRIRSWADTANDVGEAFRFFQGLPSSLHQHSEFASDWLAAREAADHRARSRELTEELNQWLLLHYDSLPPEIHCPVQIVDIGTGRGSNALFLVPFLQVPQTWLALDQDAALLREARQRVDILDVPFETTTVQLSPENMEQHLPAEVSLITASALIDLVSEPWLKTLSHAAAHRKSAMLIVLSYAGHFEVSPGHPDDELLRNLVNQHQHGDKGTGAALGPEAPIVLRDLLTQEGYRVKLAESPWTLSSGDQALVGMLMQGWTDAAIEQSPTDRDRLNRWLDTRNRQLSEGKLTVVVRHLDLLALPPGELP
ncbi:MULTISPECIES: glycosyltransferase [unclassified Marinobacter]|uniref:glycosyltransferase n=1 Tax=unclassified Marinobacter TaxID=83889 RepID=UPI001925BA64|nr:MULTISPECIES: glycosyltransferase [unclassified Marinobacter]MBL3825482.1 glycosyltransferase [Marinobacter sp. MC3]MBL3893988.1 glycosyltransferase [Marinobacter sp. MW3]